MASQAPSRARLVFLGITAVATVAVLLTTRKILLPFILALVLAYVLTPLVSLVERAKMPRWVAIVLVYVVVLGALTGFFAAIAPRLAREAYGLRREIPRLSHDIKHRWVPWVYSSLERAGLIARTGRQAGERASERTGQASGSSAEGGASAPVVVTRRQDGAYEVRLPRGWRWRQRGEQEWEFVPHGEIGRERGGAPEVDLGKMVTGTTGKAIDYVQENMLDVLRFGSHVVMYLSRGIFAFFLTLMLAAYMMLTREQILAFFRDLVPRSARESWDVLLARIDSGLSGVVRGQLVICLLNGVFAAIGFSLLGIKYWPLLALLAAVLSIIPIFGAILSAIPTVAIALTQSWGKAVAVLVLILAIHQVEANLLNPKIYGIAAKIHPVLVIFSLLVGEHFFGLVGALLAVPVMSIVQNVFLHFRTVTLGEDAPRDPFLDTLGGKGRGSEEREARGEE